MSGLPAIPSWFWWAIGAVALAGELVAIFNATRGDTLSEQTWSWAHLGEMTKTAIARRAVILLFLVWLTVHLLTGGAV